MASDFSVAWQCLSKRTIGFLLRIKLMPILKSFFPGKLSPGVIHTIDSHQKLSENAGQQSHAFLGTNPTCDGELQRQHCKNLERNN
jgi:hypothetical protein